MFVIKYQKKNQQQQKFQRIGCKKDGLAYIFPVFSSRFI